MASPRSLSALLLAALLPHALHADVCYQCPHGGVWLGYDCIPEQWMCDGYEDCVSGVDEHPETCGGGNTCSGYECSSGVVFDGYPDGCVPAGWQCDGYADCNGGEDEAGCGGGETTVTAAPPPTTTTTQTGGGSPSDCGTPAPQYPPALNTNGDSIMSLGQSIVGGDEAAPHSYPWTVRLSMGCGGSVINEQWILTAAHCVVTDSYNNVRPASSISAVIGAHSLPGAQHSSISQVLAHPNYNGDLQGTGTIGNDIALLKLASPVSFSDTVRPICLPSASDDFRSHSAGSMLAGWGGIAVNGPNDVPQSEVLKHLVLDIASCGYNESPLRICATVADGSGCMGDSGGPLSVLVGGKFTQVGIVSYGSSTCSVGSTNVYAHVPAMRQWVAQVTGV